MSVKRKEKFMSFVERIDLKVAYTLLKLFLVTLLCYVFTQRAQAVIGYEDAIFPEPIASARALAIGNAYVAGANDSNAVYYNPAGLGSVKWFHLHLENFAFEVNKNLNRMGAGGNIRNASSNFSKITNMDGIRQVLAVNRDTIYHSRYQFFPNITSRFFSLGYMYSKKTRAIIGKDPIDGTKAQFEYAGRTDHGPVGAINISVMGGVFKLGASATLLNRSEVKGEQDFDVSFEETEENTYKGVSLYGVIGSKLTFPIRFLPTFAAKMNNAFRQRFRKTGGIDSPDYIKPSVDVGFSITPQIGKTSRIHLEVNYRDMYLLHKDVASSRRIGFGMEIDLARRFHIRGGYADGFGSGGIGIKTKPLEVDITTYSVDLTNDRYKGKEDRRFMFSLSAGI